MNIDEIRIDALRIGPPVRVGQVGDHRAARLVFEDLPSDMTMYLKLGSASPSKNALDADGGITITRVMLEQIGESGTTAQLQGEAPDGSDVVVWQSAVWRTTAGPTIAADAALSDEMAPLSQQITAHMADTDIHITAEERERWDAGTGAAGPAGPQGPQGEQGPAGPAGADGAPGADGAAAPTLVVTGDLAATTAAVALADMHAWGYNELSALTLTDDLSDGDQCMVGFTSGDVATTITYPAGLRWIGDDVDSDGVFVPVSGKAYRAAFLRLSGVTSAAVGGWLI